MSGLRAHDFVARVGACSLVLVVALFGCRGDEGDSVLPLRVYAAASLADVMLEWRELAAARGLQIEVAFAGSNELARQIVAGAPADLFLSADHRQVERLVTADLVDPGQTWPLLGNRLVVVAALEETDAHTTGNQVDTRTWDQRLVAARRLALADPASVPAGIYAQQWLEERRLWPDVAPKVVPTLDVRAALAAVRSGSVDVGVVYRTDALTAPGVEVLYEVPPGEGPGVEVWLAVVADPSSSQVSQRPQLAAALELLRSEEAGAIFRRFGFETSPGSLGASAP